MNVGITALLHQQGRRVVLVFTDGMDRPMNFSNEQQQPEGRDEARRGRGRDGLRDRASPAPAAWPAFGRRLGRRGGGGGRGGGFGAAGGLGGGRPRMAVDKPDEGLPKIAAATGGGYFELTSTDDLASTFARVADELHHQYALGFTPEKLDGKMHNLALKLTRNRA